MSKIPSFQFYPEDWRKDPSLACVSHAAKGLWIDMLCLMFESDRRGYLQINGKAPTNEQLAKMVRCSPDELAQWLVELKAASVFSQTGSGILFSRRMVRDEDMRKKRRLSGKMGGNPNFFMGKTNPYYRRKDKQKDNHQHKQKDNQPDNHIDNQVVMRVVMSEDNQKKMTSSPSSSSSSSSTPLSSSSSSSPSRGTPPIIPPKGDQNGINPRQKTKQSPEDTTPFWQQMVDHWDRRWLERKKAKFFWRPQHFKNLKSLAKIYQPAGVMALTDLYISSDDLYVKNAGYSFEMFCAKIPTLLDHPSWKTMTKAHEEKLYGPISNELSEVMSTIIPNRIQEKEKEEKCL